MTVPLGGAIASGALGVFAAVGDAYAGRRLGFARRRAALAAAYARHCGEDAAGVAGAFVAGLLADTGLIDAVPPDDASERIRLRVAGDAPLYGARLAASLPGIPPTASDRIRWHRERYDGTGTPDRLRWDGIPETAAALGMAHAFTELLDNGEGPADPNEAIFALMAESGRAFRVESLRAFRAFILASSGLGADPGPIALDPLLDDDAHLATIAERIDRRDARTAGRTARIVEIVDALAARLGEDPARAMRAARLLALGRAGVPIADDEIDPLNRFSRDARGAEMRRAAQIAAAAERYAVDAPLVAAAGVWYEDGPHERISSILSLASVVTTMNPADGPRRITAAAGTQFDPAVAHAYLITQGVAT